MPDEKELSPYKQRLRNEEEQGNEVSCGIMHASIEEAYMHALSNLGMLTSDNKPVGTLQPVLGAMPHNTGTVIGWQTNSRKRFRLDIDGTVNLSFYGRTTRSMPNGKIQPFEPILLDKKTVNLKGSRGVHVNEEDFNREFRQKVSHPTTCLADQAEAYWREWSRRFGRPGFVQDDSFRKD